MECLKSKVKNQYAWHNSEIFMHGKNYFLTASSLYPHNYSSVHAYPLLTLLGLSAELFFKAFDIQLTEEFVPHVDGTKVLVGHHVKTSNNGRDQANKHNGHNLEKLLNHYSTKDSTLFEYLTTEYKSKTQRDLVKDLSKYSRLFEETRYIFEYERGKYLSDINIVFNLVEILYESISSLYKRD